MGMSELRARKMSARMHWSGGPRSFEAEPRKNIAQLVN